MGFLPGMGMRSDGLVCGIRKLEKSEIAVSGFFLVGVHGIRNGKCQVIALHAVAPEDMGTRVVFAEHMEKITDCLLKPAKVLLVVGSVRFPSLEKDLTSHRICPFRLIKCAGIVGSKIDNDSVRLPAFEIVRLPGAKLFVHFPFRKAADLFIVGRDIVAGVVIPAAKDSPAPLGDYAVLCV